MRRRTTIFTIIFLLLCNLNAPAQQLQVMDDTDSLKARREKTNANFQTLWDKITSNFSILSGKENPITVQSPLSRSSNTISCPTCLDANTTQTLTHKTFDLPVLQGYPRSSIPTGTTGNLFFLNNDVGGVWLKGRAGKSYQISGEEVNVEEFGSINAAISEFNSLVGPVYRTLVIPNEQPLAADLTIPDYATLKVGGSGLVNLNNHNLTINGPFEASARKVFIGTGQVRLLGSVLSVYPEWFAAKGDGSTDDAPALNKAAFAAGGTGNTIVLNGGRTYGIGAPLDGSTGNVSFVSRSGRAILKPLASNDILTGRYDGWNFEKVEFRGACIMNGSRKPEFRQCVFRHPSNYALQLTGVIGPKFIEPEFYGTRAGVMATGVQDPSAVPGAAYGSGLRLLEGCVDVQVIRPKFHFCYSGIGADTSTTNTMRGLYVEGIEGRSDWWSNPFVVARYTPTAYDTGTRRLTVSGGGLNAIFTGEPLRVISIPVGVSTGSSFNSLSGGVVGVASGTPFASAQKGDVIESADGRRFEVLTKISSTQVAGLGWESADTFEATTPPPLATAFRMTRHYAAGVVLVDDTHIDLYNDPVNPYSGERLVADAGLSPIGISCKTFATLIYSNLHLNGGVFDFQLKGGKVRGCRADQISIFDCEAPKVTGVTVEYGFDEGVTSTRCPRTIIANCHFEQCGVSAIAIGDGDYASLTGNIINNWGVINRNDLGAIDGNGKYMTIMGNTARVSAGGAGSGAQHFITLQYDADCSGTTIAGNADGGARVATLKTHAHTGPVIARDVHSISGAGRDNVLTGSGEQFSLRSGLMEYFPLTSDAVGKKVGVTLTNAGSVAFGADGATFGSGKRLSIAHNPLFSMGGDIDFEFVLTVKLNALTDGYILAKFVGGPSANEYELEYQSGAARFKWYVSNGTSATVVSADSLGAPSTGVSYFIRCGYDRITHRIFIQVNNGTIDYASHTGGAQVTTEPFGIGARGDGYLPIDGSIRGVGLYKQRRLNADDATKHYNGGSVLAWPLL